MTTLLIRCEALLQSWGDHSRYNYRDTNCDPTKSGVAGICCAAQGLTRKNCNEFLKKFSQLKMACRVDDQGSGCYCDFQTTQNVIQRDGNISKNAVIQYKYYLEDASFLVGLEGDTDFLKIIHASLMDPKWILFLGRKCCIPSRPLVHLSSLKKDLSLYDALREEVYESRHEDDKVRVVFDDNYGQRREDVALSFYPNPVYTYRYTRDEYWNVSDLCKRELSHVS